MIVWIVNVGENLPTDGATTRLFRCGILAKTLIERGHKVVWWTSTFDHYNKVHRYQKDIDIKIKDNYIVRFLKGSGYSKNISIKRLWDHFILGIKFKKKAFQENEIPDVIISSFPTVYLSFQSVKFGREKNVPVILDARDMWPDIFEEAIPVKFKTIGKWILKPMHKLTQLTFSGTFAITGMTDSFVEWAVKKSGRKRSNLDISFPFGYSGMPINFTSEELKEFCTSYKIDSTKCNILFVGYIGGVLDINMLVAVAKIIEDSQCQTDIVICGIGEYFDVLKQETSGLSNVHLLGWQDGKGIGMALSVSSYGIIPYKNRPDFMGSIPNKVPEYMSHGLPVITSLQGTVAEIVKNNNCGIFIENPSGILEAINIFYKNKSKYMKLRDQSSLYFKTHFDAQVVYSNMSDYLEKISFEYKTTYK
ncbi:MAG: glycosyltransferase family 4 protein [Bacteroidetes bacterium]|nr:glycosyltransferase family 4 protein [Bacteroidota bacterium]